jgi:hypothetical protein
MTMAPNPPHATQFPAWAALRPVAWLLMSFGAFKAYADPDLWGHVRFGLDMLQSRRLPSMDPYSFTQDIPWTNHEWLSEAIDGFAFSRAGAAGLIVFKATIVLLSYWLIAGALRRSPDKVRWGAVALAAGGALPITYTIRPQLWTLLLLMAQCRLLIGPPRFLWLVPLLFLPWANLHGGWIVGWGLLALWCASRLTEPADRRPPAWALGLLVALSGLTTLANPYGLGLWRFLATTVRLSRVEIQEWQPLWRDTPSSWILWTCGVTYAAYVVRRYGRPPTRTATVVAAFAGASLLVNRLVPLFVPATVVLLAPMLERGNEASSAAPLQRTLFDVAVTVIVSILVVHSTVLNGCIDVSGDWVADAQAARALRDSGARGRLITWFNWGEYALWHLSPNLKISFDGRRETVYSPETIREQLSIAGGDVSGLAALERLSPEYVWLPNRYSQTTKGWLQSHRYRVDIDTPASFVAVREDLTPVRAAEGLQSGCFP